MANRSYLYASDVIPGQPDAEGGKLVGLSERRYDIPLVFKLLASGRPRLCPSVIWSDYGEVAIVGDYAAGLAALDAFLARVQHAAAQPLVNEALDFLRAPQQRARYIVLDAGELLEMDEVPLHEQARMLLAELQDLTPGVEDALADLPPPPNGAPVQGSPRSPGWWTRWFGRPPVPTPAPDEAASPGPFLALGLGNWSSTLYHDPAASNAHD